MMWAVGVPFDKILQVVEQIIFLGVGTIVVMGIGKLYMDLLRKFFLYTPSSNLPEPPEPLLNFQTWYMNAAGLWFLGWAVSGFLSFKVLSTIANIYHAPAEGICLIPIDEAYWAMPAIFGGMVLAIPFSCSILKLLLRDRYVAFLRLCEKSSRINNKANWFLCYWVTIGVLISIYLGLNTYTRFSELGIAIHPYFGLQEETYSYTGVRSLELVAVPLRTRTSSPQSYYKIVLGNGSEWKTSIFDPGSIPPLYTEAMQFVASRTHKDIQLTQEAPVANQ
jgi:hypothetical protein